MPGGWRAAKRMADPRSPENVRNRPIADYILLYIMRNIDMLPGAKTDLAALRLTDRTSAAEIAVLLQEADADPRIIEKLTTHGDVTIGNSHLVNVVGWVEARHGGDNLFRLKALDPVVPRYRVIYGFDWHTRRIGILAVVKRDDKTYRKEAALARRIFEDWRNATGGATT